MRRPPASEAQSAFSPPGYRGVQIGGAHVIAREPALSFVEEAIASSGTLYGYAAQHPERETIRGRTTVFVIPGPGPDRWLVRRLSHGGLLAPLTGDRFLSLGTPRPFNELYLSLAFRDHAIPTPEVTAAAVYASGMIYRGEVARELITDAADVAACLFGDIRLDEAQRHQVMTAAGGLLCSLFEAGVVHRDLNLRNVLIRWREGSAEAYILDIEKCAIVPQLSGRQRQRMLRRFGRSATRFGDRTGQHLTDADWAAFHSGLGGPAA
jgi:hypothetical protein